ncbi:MAG: hypothetical protein VYC34_07095 [Planctomycetota bacterium]|nr:hypothetical protein [Planctomycetota bacterium]
MGTRMIRGRRLSTVVLAASILAVTAGSAAGCSKHYRITDPTTGATYYTKKVHQVEGAVRFKDHGSGNQVNIQNAEIDKISKREFKRGVH